MLASRRFWAGSLITAVFLALLFLRVDLAGLGDALAQANYAYLIPGVGLYFISLYFRSVRWRFLLRPFTSTSAMRLYPVILVGYLANNILPMRIGELVRSYYLSVREPIRGSTGLATVIVERVFDGLTLLLFLLIGALLLPFTDLLSRVSEVFKLPPWIVAGLVTAPFVGVLIFMVLAALKPEPFLRISRLFARKLPDRFYEALVGFVERFLVGFRGLQRPGRLATVFALSLPVWLLEGLMYYVIGLGFGLDRYFENYWHLAAAMMIVVSISNLATSIPSSQGSVGPFEFFAAEALRTMGIGSGLASAYAIVLHIALLVPVILAGLVHLAVRSVSLSELTSQKMQPGRKQS